MIAGELDKDLLQTTVATAVQMLDNVIDINYYPIPESEYANKKHRPIGLGLMGFQDALYEKGISYASEEAACFADESMELISYYAIRASGQLAMDRGCYSSFEGSDWSLGFLPIDSADREKMNGDSRCDWNELAEFVQHNGLRNSNILALDPTATISIIAGCSQSIEPQYRNLYAKSNLSGDFTYVNQYLVEDLRKTGLWDTDMLEKLKYCDGSVQTIREIPDAIKEKYRTAFEVDPEMLIECASRRQKWIDQGQSLNLYMAEPSGKKLHDMYLLAWKKGLKTTYYLRTCAATQVEKSTLNVNKFGIQPRWMQHESASAALGKREDQDHKVNNAYKQACSGTICEVCQ